VHLQKQLRAPHSILASSNSKHPFGSYLRKRSETIRKVPLGLGLLFGPFASLAFLGARTCGPRGLACFVLQFRTGRKIFSDLADWIAMSVLIYPSTVLPAFFYLFFLKKSKIMFCILKKWFLAGLEQTVTVLD